jgi:hypothetical protein
MRLGAIGSVTRKLVNADVSGLQRMLEDMGRDAILDLVGGGATPIGVMLNAFLTHLEQTSRMAQKLQNREEAERNKPLTVAEKRRRKLAHQEWLRENSWRFDWRSQPRRPAGTDAGGEWMDGRLDYQAETKNPVSRRELRRRTRSMRQYKARMRAAGNNRTRVIRSRWGDF